MILDDDALQRLYAWIDEIPLSRPKKNITRDFGDGVLTAEILAFYFPKLVHLHNYSAANSIQQKNYNWNTLNRIIFILLILYIMPFVLSFILYYLNKEKVLKKINCYLNKAEIDDIVQCKAGSVENILARLQTKIAVYQNRKHSGSKDNSLINMENSPKQFNGRPVVKLEQQRSKDNNFINDIIEKPTQNQEWPVVPLPAPVPIFSKTDSNGNEQEKSFQDIIIEKDSIIQDQKETIQILEMKIQKLEQLVRLKDGKIQILVTKLQSQD